MSRASGLLCDWQWDRSTDHALGSVFCRQLHQKELAADLVKIALFDVVLLADDSGSMQFEQGGERIEDLKM